MNPMPSSEHLLFLSSQMFHIMHIGAVIQIFSYSQPTVLANLRAMLLKLFKYVVGCVSDSPNLVHFGGSDTSAATLLESPRNIA